MASSIAVRGDAVPVPKDGLDLLLRSNETLASKQERGIETFSRATTTLSGVAGKLEAAMKVLQAGSGAPVPIENKSLAKVGDADAATEKVKLDDAPAKATVVDMGMVVERIFDVNTIEQCFSCQIKVTMIWACPPYEEPPDPAMDDGDWEPTWTPKIMVRNLLEEIMGRQDHYKIITGANAREQDKEGRRLCSEHFCSMITDGGQYVKGEVRFLVRIAEPLELASFPTDCQDLHVELLSKMASEQVRWSLHECLVSSERCSLNDFTLVKERPYTFNMCQIQQEDCVYYTIAVTVKIVRKSMYYHLNISLVMFLIITAVFCAWGLHPGDIPGRQGVDFNLILTAVAFSVTKTEMLPKVSYVTYIDIYIYICWVFLLAVTLIHCVLPYQYFDKIEMSAITLAPGSWDEPREQEFIDHDMEVCYILAGVWAAVNVLFFSLLKAWGNAEYQAFAAKAAKEQRDFDKSNNEVVDDVKQFLAPASSMDAE